MLKIFAERCCSAKEWSVFCREGRKQEILFCDMSRREAEALATLLTAAMRLGDKNPREYKRFPTSIGELLLRAFQLGKYGNA